MDSLSLTQTPKPRGRPPVSQPRRVSVTTWLTPQEADRLIERAKMEPDRSVSALVRKIITSRIR